MEILYLSSESRQRVYPQALSVALGGVGVKPVRTLLEFYDALNGIKGYDLGVLSAEAPLERESRGKELFGFDSAQYQKASLLTRLRAEQNIRPLVVFHEAILKQRSEDYLANARKYYLQAGATGVVASHESPIEALANYIRALKK